jgi:hypothetical protein
MLGSCFMTHLDQQLQRNEGMKFDAEMRCGPLSAWNINILMAALRGREDLPSIFPILDLTYEPGKSHNRKWLHAGKCDAYIWPQAG